MVLLFRWRRTLWLEYPPPHLRLWARRVRQGRRDMEAQILLHPSTLVAVGPLHKSRSLTVLRDERVAQ